MENLRAKDDITVMLKEAAESGVITCPRCEKYNAILVTYNQDQTHNFTCRDCDYDVIQSRFDYDSRQPKKMSSESRQDLRSLIKDDILEDFEPAFEGMDY